MNDDVQKDVLMLYDKLFMSAYSTDPNLFTVSGKTNSNSLFQHQLSSAEIRTQLQVLNTNAEPFNLDVECLPFSSAYSTGSCQRIQGAYMAEVFMGLPESAKIRVVCRELELALDVLAMRSRNYARSDEIERLSASYPKASITVDGRRVRENIQNLGSIRKTLDEYVTLPSLREVPVSEFDLSGRSYSDLETKSIHRRAEIIKESGEINPIIVVVDAEGPYILEGGEARAGALFILGAKSFPALVVIDTAEPAIAVESAVELSNPLPSNLPRRRL